MSKLSKGWRNTSLYQQYLKVKELNLKTKTMKQNTTKQPLEEGKKYHIDCEFEGERLVDDVKLIELLPQGRFALVHSHKLLSDILIPRTELKEIEPMDSKEGLHTHGETVESLLIDLLRVASKNDEEFDDGQGLFDLDLIRYITDLNQKAVNERKALLDSHRELLDIVKRLDYWHHVEHGAFTYTDPNVDGDQLTIQLQNAINNAKNI